MPLRTLHVSVDADAAETLARAVSALSAPAPSLHRLLAAVAVVGFPPAGLAPALGYLTSGAFVAIAAASCVTFTSTLVALAREGSARESAALRDRRIVQRPREEARLQ